MSFQKSLWLAARRPRRWLARRKAYDLWEVGQIQRRRGRWDRALQSLEQARGSFQALEDRRGEAYTLWGIGEVQRLQGQWDRALESLEQARRLFQASGDQRGEAYVLRGIGDVQGLQGEVNRSLESLEQALRLFQILPDRLGEAHALWGIGEVQRLQGQWDQALECYRQARDIFRVLEDRRGEAHALWGIGEVQRLQGQGDRALQSLEQARRRYRKLKDPLGEAYALWGIGEVQRQRGQVSQALESYQQALKRYWTLGDRSGLIHTQEAMGQAYQQQGQTSQAYLAYRDALEEIEALRGLQQREGSRRAVLEQLVSPYAAMVQVCLELGRFQEAWHWAERGKGRVLLDLLGSARPRLDTPEKRQAYEAWQRLEQEAFALEEQLRRPGPQGDGPSRPELAERLDRVRPEEARRRQQVAQMIEEGRELLQISVPSPEELALQLRDLAQGGEGSPHARPLLVEYFLLEENRYALFLLPLWQVTPGEPLPLRARSISLPEGALRKAMGLLGEGLCAARLGFVGRYRGEAAAGAQELTEEGREAARRRALEAFAALPAELGEAFVKPWAETLEELQPTGLLLVPHGELHLLPLHAARLADGAPLIERYPLVYLAKAALAQTLTRRRPGEERPEGRLVMGPPGQDLPGAWIETLGLTEAWDLQETGQPYALEQMRVQVLRDHARRLERAHLATHSAFDPQDYLRSRIQFFQEWLTLAGLISDETLDFHGMRLFYLSSCESGLAHANAADELQGLVWALLYAGAGAVMASLWPVDDEAAAYMAHVFHYHGRPGTSLMEAYRKAIGQLRKESRFENPYYWAPFVLFGDGF